MLFPSVKVKYVRPVIESDGAIAFDTCSQYDKPYDPGLKPEKVSVTDRTIEVPGFQTEGPVNDKL